MKETLLTRKDDNVGDGPFDSVAWALETHVKIPDTSAYISNTFVQPSKFQSAILYGNEDAPEMIDFYTQPEPLITDKVAYRWVA